MYKGGAFDALVENHDVYKVKPFLEQRKALTRTNVIMVLSYALSKASQL